MGNAFAYLALFGFLPFGVALFSMYSTNDLQTVLEEYFGGSRTEFDIPLAPEGTPFQQQAWSVLRSIPFGVTMSYGEQAAALGDRNRARAVGAANGRNPIPIVVPCHRVVGSNGHLTGFGGGIDAKAWLLDHERFVSFDGASRRDQ